MFGIVWGLSATIGTLVVLEVSLLTLACGLAATPFTMLLGVIGGVLGILSGEEKRKRDSRSQLPFKEAVNGFCWGPLAWAWAVAATTWARLGYYLSSTSQNEGAVKPDDTWPSAMFGVPLRPRQRTSIQNGSVNTMLAITLFLDAVSIPIGFGLNWW